ncbi:MAG: pyridoxamine 5'-phosphate oxidase family protein [Gammaproteobacteria bacterium]
MPFKKMQDWLEAEKNLGSPNPAHVVLATTTSDAKPHSRVVAIREIQTDGILFFTQSRKRKAIELKGNSSASLTLWLPLQQREVILDGHTIFLTDAENDHYWETLPRERQLLFSVYSPISDEAISSTKDLDIKQEILIEKYHNKAIPRNEGYIGFKFIPQHFYFYTLGINAFSELLLYSLNNQQWALKQLSP